AAMGDDPTVTAVLLTASDATAGARLARREHGDSLAAHAERSARAARRLEERAAAHVHRVATEDRPVEQIAAELARLWLGDALPAEAHRRPPLSPSPATARCAAWCWTSAGSPWSPARTVPASPVCTARCGCSPSAPSAARSAPWPEKAA